MTIEYTSCEGCNTPGGPLSCPIHSRPALPPRVESFFAPPCEACEALRALLEEAKQELRKIGEESVKEQDHVARVEDDLRYTRRNWRETTEALRKADNFGADLVIQNDKLREDVAALSGESNRISGELQEADTRTHDVEKDATRVVRDFLPLNGEKDECFMCIIGSKQQEHHPGARDFEHYDSDNLWGGDQKCLWHEDYDQAREYLGIAPKECLGGP